MANTIDEVSVNTSAMSTLVNNRSIRVTGSADAIFSLQVSRSSDGQFYDFSTGLFSATYSSQSRLKNLSPGRTNISFPASSTGDTYTIYVWPEPHFNTEMAFGTNKLRHVEQIEQVGADATITFKVDTIGYLTAFTLGTSTGSTLNTYSNSLAPTLSFVKTQIANVANAANHGVSITTPTPPTTNSGTYDSNAFYWSTVAADHETTSASSHDAEATSTALVLNNVDGLYVGMHVSVIESGSVTSTMPTITAIDTDTLTVTLSAAQTWAIGKDITFRAYGVNLIDKAIDIKLFTDNTLVELGQVSTMIRTEITSNIVETGEINVKGTGGIGAGSSIRIKGLNNSTEEDETIITIVDGSLTEGTIVLENATLEASVDDPVRAGTVLYVDGTSNEVFLTGSISVNKYPTDDQDIFLDISKFLTLGTPS
jgi:hypothetical protein